jgi:hypothetical protein
MCPTIDDTFWDPDEMEELRKEQGRDRPMAYLPMPEPMSFPLMQDPKEELEHSVIIIDM